MPGSMRSSTMTSGGWLRTASTALDPSWTTSTSYPSYVSERRTEAAMRVSSSTTRIRGLGIIDMIDSFVPRH